MSQWNTTPSPAACQASCVAVGRGSSGGCGTRGSAGEAHATQKDNRTACRAQLMVARAVMLRNRAYRGFASAAHHARSVATPACRDAASGE